MPLMTWNDYPDLINGIANGSWRVIGWGAGVGFINYHESTLIKHDYLVDNDEAKWGSYVGGFLVKPPISIASENISRTIIIIYNFWDHGRTILADLDKIGPYKSIMNFNPVDLFKFTKKLSDGIGNIDCKPQANSQFGIVVQGPFYEHNTLLILKYYSNKYPRDWLILSTWDNTPESQLNLVRKYCDAIVTNPSPYPGYGNRNNLLTSTYAGLKKAKELGAKFILKTRTDTLASGFDILNRSRQFISNHNQEKCKEHGLYNRIIVTERFTLRFFPYMVSEIIMYGHIDDLISFFSAPHDERNLEFSDIKNASIETIVHTGYLTEVYLIRHFLKRIGWVIKDDIYDYWAMLKNLFIVVDERWFGHYFPKYDFSNLDGIKKISDKNSFVDFNFWTSICNDEKLNLIANNINIKSMTYDDFFHGLSYTPGFSDLQAHIVSYSENREKIRIRKNAPFRQKTNPS